MITEEDKIKLSKISEEIAKKFDGATIQCGTNTYSAVESTKTGLPSLDVALGCGGIPSGRVIELYGNESSGKTSLCLQIISSFQKQGGIAAFVDAENALDPSWASRIGVDMEQMLLSQPSSGEEAFHIVESLVKSDICSLVVVDSVAALVSQQELDTEIGGTEVIGAQARMMSKCLRKLVAPIKKSNCSVIFINQVRDKIGGFSPGFVKPESTPGGRALKFYSSIRIETKRAATIKNKEHAIGIDSSISIRKNKVAPPFMATKVKLYFGSSYQEGFHDSPDIIHGYDKVESLITGAKDAKVLTIKGSMYYLGEERLANGIAALTKLVREDESVRSAIESNLYEALNNRIK